MKTAPALAALLLVAALLTPSCSVTSQVSLDYVPAPGHTQLGAAEFTTRPFVDRRGEHPTFLGTVRTQIGTPVEQVNTRLPVDTIVTNAFGHALQARGMLTSPSAARYIVTGEVLDLYCQMLVRPYGYARLRVSVLEAGSGQIIFSRVYTGERQGSAFVPGSGSPVGELRQLTSGALQDAVDRALDDRDLRMSLDGGAGGGGYDMNPGGGNPSPRFVPGML